MQIMIDCLQCQILEKLYLRKINYPFAHFTDENKITLVSSMQYMTGYSLFYTKSHWWYNTLPYIFMLHQSIHQKCDFPCSHSVVYCIRLAFKPNWDFWILKEENKFSKEWKWWHLRNCFRRPNRWKSLAARFGL